MLLDDLLDGVPGLVEWLLRRLFAWDFVDESGITPSNSAERTDEEKSGLAFDIGFSGFGSEVFLVVGIAVSASNS